MWMLQLNYLVYHMVQEREAITERRCRRGKRSYPSPGDISREISKSTPRCGTNVFKKKLRCVCRTGTVEDTIEREVISAEMWSRRRGIEGMRRAGPSAEGLKCIGC